MNKKEGGLHCYRQVFSVALCSMLKRFFDAICNKKRPGSAKVAKTRLKEDGARRNDVSVNVQKIRQMTEEAFDARTETKN